MNIQNANLTFLYKQNYLSRQVKKYIMTFNKIVSQNEINKKTFNKL